MLQDMPQLESISFEIDQPNENERQYEQLFGNSNIEEDGYNVFYPPSIFNQGAKASTRMGCSRYGIIHAINAQNLAVAAVDKQRTYEYNPEVMWGNYLKTNPSAEQEGATLQSSLEQMLELSLITGYSRVTTIEQMKQALQAFRPIYTGSKQCNWTSVRDYKRYELGTGYAHIFCIVGFDGSGWVAINSYGPSNGVFHIDFKFTDSLFSCYAISDSRDQHLFNA